MKYTENEISLLKTHHFEMWNLVQTQVNRSFQALERADANLAREVLSREKYVNAQELVVDHHCENFIALYAPVAVDLRFVISLLKITNNLERIGDFAESIALFVFKHLKEPLPKELWKALKMDNMMHTAQDMLSVARTSLTAGKSDDCGKILAMDDILDEINARAVSVLAGYIRSHPDAAEDMLYTSAVIRRIERIGDRVENIAEDIVFFIDAKELRHLKDLDQSTG
ncbi:MAG TPA: phosphate signaling complex protein PhoU [Bacteroidales bacterium]|nr:phosphate signaling complex protein PhoU [Bacteroidales bacterium]